MDCPRCGGLMVTDWFQDLRDETGEIAFYGLRCVICGEILDPKIVMNRRLSESCLRGRCQ